MGARPLAVQGSSPPDSWRLAGPCAQDAQGLLVSPFAHLEAGLALLLQVPAGAGGGWLGNLRQAVPITNAAGKTSPCAAIAFTWSGLAAMGLGSDVLASFADPFRQGMLQADRRRRLGDEAPLLAPGAPLWSANIEPAPGMATPATAHLVLLLYAEDAAAAQALADQAKAAVAPAGVTAVREIALSLRFDATNVAREHFGFADGLSHPAPFGNEIVTASGAPAPRDPWHGVHSGDVILGHVNAHGELAPGPVVKESAPGAAALAVNGAPEGFRDLGLNGSYLVIRELRQDVALFWASMQRSAEVLGDGTITARDVAERAIGRTLDGAPLTPTGPLPPQAGAPANSFGYLANDPHGFGCPVGSHIRRANPRDGLAPKPKLGPDLLEAANNHRILRRGRKFGPDFDPSAPDTAERGLLFMALNTDIARQFEFIQQTWMLNRTFAALFDETDPILGPAGAFTIPDLPLRRRAQVETFVQFVGGDYFFLPSLTALSYLEGLP